jgi:GT2 family glycosyltransferase
MAARPPLISVVIPTRNRVDHLREAVRSITRQSYKHWECVVVDDASSDGTAEWLRGVPDRRIRSRVLERHSERSATRNAGLAISKGSYVLFLDDDDLLAKGALHWLVRAALRHGSAATVGSSRRFTENGMARRQFVHPRVHWTGEVWREAVFGWGTVPGAILFAREALERAGGWDESIRWAEDHDLLLRVSALGAFAFVPWTVLAYRLPGASTRALIERSEMTDVRGRYVATLPAERSAIASPILEAGRAFDRAQAAFRSTDLRRAQAELRRALQLAPWVSRSILLGPSVMALRAKLALGHVAGPRTITGMRTIRTRGRAMLRRDPDRYEGH